ncbi:MAG: DNA polymerase III subunit delta, partial [Bradymonadaceae bacterium]
MGKRLRRARQFIRDVRDDEPDPLYFVYGEEGYLLDRAVETILESAVPEEERNDFNFDEYRGRSASGEDVLESVEMLPMMVQRRAVVVRDLQEMPTTELAELEKYFEDPSSKTCLVLHARTSDDAAPLDMNSGVVRTL